MQQQHEPKFMEQKAMSDQNEVSLIKRIDEMIAGSRAEPVGYLLRDCRAEIERLTQWNQCLRDQNTALDEKLAEYSERTYTPMTDDEIIEIADTAESNAFRMGSIVQETGYEGYRAIEAAVIKRLGLEIKHD